MSFDARPASLILLLLALAPTASAQDEVLRGSGVPPMPGATRVDRLETLGDAVGTWTLSPRHSGERCELSLDGESGPNGRALRVPADCRKILPILARAAGWLFVDKGVRIVDRDIRPLISFLPLDDAGGKAAEGLVGKTEGGKSFELVPGSIGASPARAGQARAPDVPATANDERAIPGSQPVLRSDVLAPRADQPREADQKERPLAPAARRPPPGTYALDRFEAKDVCRIALEPGKAPAKEATSGDPLRDFAPARLLPGCRDKGIETFDPVSWRFASGHITLKAKRGHAINLVAAGDGSWRRDPDTGTTFVLRKVEP